MQENKVAAVLFIAQNWERLGFSYASPDKHYWRCNDFSPAWRELSDLLSRADMFPTNDRSLVQTATIAIERILNPAIHFRNHPDHPNHFGQNDEECRWMLEILSTNEHFLQLQQELPLPRRHFNKNNAVSQEEEEEEVEERRNRGGDSLLPNTAMNPAHQRSSMSGGKRVRRRRKNGMNPIHDSHLPGGNANANANSNSNSNSNSNFNENGILFRDGVNGMNNENRIRRGEDGLIPIQSLPEKGLGSIGGGVNERDIHLHPNPGLQENVIHPGMDGDDTGRRTIPNLIGIAPSPSFTLEQLPANAFPAHPPPGMATLSESTHPTAEERVRNPSSEERRGRGKHLSSPTRGLGRRKRLCVSSSLGENEEYHPHPHPHPLQSVQPPHSLPSFLSSMIGGGEGDIPEVTFSGNLCMDPSTMPLEMGEGGQEINGVMYPPPPSPLPPFSTGIPPADLPTQATPSIDIPLPPSSQAFSTVSTNHVQPPLRMPSLHIPNPPYPHQIGLDEHGMQGMSNPLHATTTTTSTPSNSHFIPPPSIPGIPSIPLPTPTTTTTTKKGKKSTKKNKKNSPVSSLPALIAQFAHYTAKLMNAYHQQQTTTKHACPHCRKRKRVAIPPTNNSSLDSMDDLLTAMDSETTGMSEWDGLDGLSGFNGFDPDPFTEEEEEEEEESMNSE